MICNMIFIIPGQDINFSDLGDGPVRIKISVS